MLRLYDFGNSVCCQKARITMRAKGRGNRLHGSLEVIYRFPNLVSFVLDMSEKGTSQFLFVTHAAGLIQRSFPPSSASVCIKFVRVLPHVRSAIRDIAAKP
jgi:hypothetical protein